MVQLASEDFFGEQSQTGNVDNDDDDDEDDGAGGEDVSIIPNAGREEKSKVKQSNQVEPDQQQQQQTAERDSPLVELPISRPESATSRRKLDTLIMDCFRSDNFKKLEHLILAGCGHRLLRMLSKFCGESTKLSPRMQEFLEHQTPEYMKTIELIHKTLHECYRSTLNRTRSSPAAAGRSRPDGRPPPAHRRGCRSSARHARRRWSARPRRAGQPGTDDLRPCR